MPSPAPACRPSVPAPLPLPRVPCRLGWLWTGRRLVALPSAARSTFKPSSSLPSKSPSLRPAASARPGPGAGGRAGSGRARKGGASFLFPSFVNAGAGHGGASFPVLRFQKASSSTWLLPSMAPSSLPPPGSGRAQGLGKGKRRPRSQHACQTCSCWQVPRPRRHFLGLRRRGLLSGAGGVRPCRARPVAPNP